MPRVPKIQQPRYIVYGAGERPYGVETLRLARKLAKERVRVATAGQPGGPTRPEAYIEKLTVPKMPGVRIPPVPRYDFIEKHKLDTLTGQIRRQVHLD